MRDEVFFMDQPMFQLPESRSSPLKIEFDGDQECTPHFPSIGDLPKDPALWANLENVQNAGSIFDQLLKAYTSSDFQPCEQPFECTREVRKLALHKWIVFLNHAIHCLVLTKGEPYLNNTHFSSPLSALWAPRTEEWLLGRLVKWSRRLHMEHSVISTTMRSLGMDLRNPDASGCISTTEAKQWHYIRDKLLEYKSLYDDTAASYMQVMSLRESQTSNDQARSVGRITLIASLFVPVSLVSGIFSMGGAFAPGKDHFWVFFVVVVPVVFAVWASLFTKFGPWVKRLSAAVLEQARGEAPILPVFHRSI